MEGEGVGPLSTSQKKRAKVSWVGAPRVVARDLKGKGIVLVGFEGFGVQGSERVSHGPIVSHFQGSSLEGC